MLDPDCFQMPEQSLAFFERHLAKFVPPDAFDAHAHLFDLRHLLTPEMGLAEVAQPQIGFERMQSSMRRWMGERLITAGLYFPFPLKTLDRAAANSFLAEELAAQPNSRGLMMIAPADDPDEVEQEVRARRWAGFKVYHVFAARPDTFHAPPAEYLPDWAWEIADRHGLWITLHMVLPHALSDPQNSDYIREQCLRFPNTRLVLAHAARGFNASHTADAIGTVRGLDNVFFDTSAICEPTAFEAILRATGTTRLMYGSDFPISDFCGKAVSVGDGFMWLYQHNVDWDSWQHGRLWPVGIESLLALQQAARTLGLADRDLERIFSTNARALLSLAEPVSGDMVQAQYRHAKEVIPGGTQLLSKRPEMFAPDVWPAYFEQAIGCEVIDTAGRKFIDMSSGGILSCSLGYADPDVNQAVLRRVHLGSMSTLQTHDEVELADLLLEIHPWAEQARFARSGGEAMSVAVRIARAATGRDAVAICGYHGWHDWYLAANLNSAGPGALAGHLLPGLEPQGVPEGLRGTVHPFNYNRLEELEQIAATRELAAIVMEPTRHREPEPGFLEGVRALADRTGARLIFDEISVGWRLCLGGAHLKFGVTPDIAVFAKAMSNGFAMAAILGRRATMQAAETSFISSTYWTEGVGPAAALATVRKMQRIDVPAHLANLGRLMTTAWQTLGNRHEVPVTVGGRPEMLLLGFDHPSAAALMTLFTTRMLDAGFLAAGSFNPMLAHEARHVQAFEIAAETVFPEIRKAIEQDDVLDRIGGKVKHSTFARLT